MQHRHYKRLNRINKIIKDKKMSLKVLGILEFNNELELKTEVELSFLISTIALQNKFGINLGGNIFPGFLKIGNEYSKKIYFELTDDPMDINAECLFAGDNVTVKVNDVQINNEESLASRMIRVQNFLEELLKIKNTIRIILDINALNIDESLTDIIKINVKDFQSKMIDLYKLNNNWEPTTRVILIN